MGYIKPKHSSTINNVDLVRNVKKYLKCSFLSSEYPLD